MLARASVLGAFLDFNAIAVAAARAAGAAVPDPQADSVQRTHAFGGWLGPEFRLRRIPVVSFVVGC